MRERYWLSRYCFICVVSDAVMCMDVRNFRCFTLGSSRSNVLCPYVSGWPELESKDEVQVNAREVITDLVNKGILVTEPLEGKAASPVSVPNDTTALLEEYERVEHRLSLRDVLLFALAALSTFRMFGLEERVISKRLATPKEQGSESTPQRALDLGKLRRLFSVFESMRPYLPESEDRRKSEQLVLIRFLELNGFSPKWVFGVAREPFRSRSWILCGTIVVDDATEIASTYVPIVVG